MAGPGGGKGGRVLDCQREATVEGGGEIGMKRDVRRNEEELEVAV